MHGLRGNESYSCTLQLSSPPPAPANMPASRDGYPFDHVEWVTKKSTTRLKAGLRIGLWDCDAGLATAGGRPGANANMART